LAPSLLLDYKLSNILATTKLSNFIIQYCLLKEVVSSHMQTPLFSSKSSLLGTSKIHKPTVTDFFFFQEKLLLLNVSCTAERTGAGVMHAVRRNARQAPHPVAKLGKRFAVAIFMHLRLLVLRPAI
jgi:hypothetical protein